MKRIEYFGETDFDLEGMAKLFLASDDIDFRRGPDAVALHVSALLNNDDCPTVIHNDLGDAVCQIGSGRVGDSLRVIAAEVRSYMRERVEEKVEKGGA